MSPQKGNLPKRVDAKQCKNCRTKQQKDKSSEIHKRNRSLEKEYDKKEEREKLTKETFKEIEENTKSHDLAKIREKIRAIPFYQPTIRENAILKNAIYPEGFNYHGDKNFDKSNYMKNKLKEIGYTENDFEILKEHL